MWCLEFLCASWKKLGRSRLQISISKFTANTLFQIANLTMVGFNDIPKSVRDLNPPLPFFVIGLALLFLERWLPSRGKDARFRKLARLVVVWMTALALALASYFEFYYARWCPVKPALY